MSRLLNMSNMSLNGRAQWREAQEKRTDMCNWIAQISGIPTMLDVRRTAKYHHREVSLLQLSFLTYIVTVEPIAEQSNQEAYVSGFVPRMFSRKMLGSVCC